MSQKTVIAIGYYRTVAASPAGGALDGDRPRSAMVHDYGEHVQLESQQRRPWFWRHLGIK